MTTEVVVFPDAITVVATYLRAQLPSHGYTGIHVGSRVPDPRPARFVRVDRVGGAKPNLVTDAATLVVEAWAADEPAAHTLAQVCRGLVHAMEGTTQSGVPIYRVNEFAGPATLPDPTSDQARATQTLQVHLRGSAA
jgi:hypothetical protein